MATTTKAMKKTRTIRYFTRQHLTEAADRGSDWGYNRQIDPAAVAKLPDLRFPVTFTMDHCHKGGEPCEPHVRCTVTLNDKGDHLMVDVPQAFFAALPVARVPASY